MKREDVNTSSLPQTPYSKTTTVQQDKCLQCQSDLRYNVAITHQHLENEGEGGI